MSVLITLLCGCLYVHNMATCALQSIPPSAPPKRIALRVGGFYALCSMCFPGLQSAFARSALAPQTFVCREVYGLWESVLRVDASLGGGERRRDTVHAISARFGPARAATKTCMLHGDVMVAS